jgi:hypothetical protein
VRKKMFDIEQAIKKWKQGLAANQAMEEGYVAELEAHLRDRVEELTGQGVAAQDAFEQTSRSAANSTRPTLSAARDARPGSRRASSPRSYGIISRWPAAPCAGKSCTRSST